MDAAGQPPLSAFVREADLVGRLAGRLDSFERGTARVAVRE